MITVKQSRRVRNEGNKRDAIPSTTVSSKIPEIQRIWLRNDINIFMPQPLVPEALCFRVVRLSVRPKLEIPSFHLYMGPLVHPTNRDRFATCPSVRPEKFLGICRRMQRVNGLKLCMPMYLDYFPNCGPGMLIFLILALFWLMKRVKFVIFGYFPENAWRK